MPEKLYHLITRLGKKDFFTNSLSTGDILEKYKKDTWKSNIAYLLGNKKKLLLVSDFTNRIGGIETYINDAKDMLEQMGYEVQLFGIRIPRGFRGKMMKYLGMAASLGNFRASIQLRRKIRRYKPDLIRYHSILRYL